MKPANARARPRRRSDERDHADGTVLAADDDPVALAILRQVLMKSGYRVITAENGRIACELVRRELPDLVLLNWSMPVMDGLAALDILKADAATRDIPVIMLTSYASLKEQGFHAGADDFIVKPFDHAELVARVRQQCRLRRQASEMSALALHTEAKALELQANERTGTAAQIEQLRQFATRDALTGLPNRMQLSDQLDQIIRAAQSRNKHFATYFLDLDGFKEINDRHGHFTGDQVLRAVGGRIEACVRIGDAVARLGGDEFVVIAPNIGTPRNARDLAERLVEAIRAPMVIEGITVCVSTSLGISLYPIDATDGQALVGCADSAMYISKRAGKNRCTFASEGVLGDERLWTDAFGKLSSPAR